MSTAHIARHIVKGTEYENQPLEHEVETSFSVDELARFRTSVFRQRGTFAAVLRIIPLDVPRFEDGLNLPKAVEKLAEFRSGLALIVGTAGCGKSTTLTAVLNRINETRRGHIISIEDPIEFLHADIKCSVTQREVGRDSPAFYDALRSALRQDPDVIAVGELRDRETIEIALRAAQTGHLVLSTLHTTDATEAISRMLGVFGSADHATIRYQLADSIRAVVAQRLVPTKEKDKLTVATEILMSNLTIQDYIRSGRRIEDIRGAMEKQRDANEGSQTFDKDLRDLFQEGVISRDTAMAYATTPADFERALHFE